MPERPPRPPTTQAAFRLGAVDLEIIDEAQRRESLPSRAEALRQVLRQWAKCQKYEIRSARGSK